MPSIMNSYFNTGMPPLTCTCDALYLKAGKLHISEAVSDRYNSKCLGGLSLVAGQKNGLKPGIDTAQFQLVIVQTEIDYLQTEKTYLQKLEELTRLTGLETPAESLAPGRFAP